MYPAAGQGVQFASGAAGGTGRGSGCLCPEQVRSCGEPAAWQDGREYRVYDSKQAFIGIYRYDAEEAYFRLVKMFYDGQAG